MGTSPAPGANPPLALRPPRGIPVVHGVRARQHTYRKHAQKQPVNIRRIYGGARGSPCFFWRAPTRSGGRHRRGRTHGRRAAPRCLRFSSFFLFFFPFSLSFSCFFCLVPLFIFIVLPWGNWPNALYNHRPDIRINPPPPSQCWVPRAGAAFGPPRRHRTRRAALKRGRGVDPNNRQTIVRKLGGDPFAFVPLRLEFEVAPFWSRRGQSPCC